MAAIDCKREAIAAVRGGDSMKRPIAQKGIGRAVQRRRQLHPADALHGLPDGVNTSRPHAAGCSLSSMMALVRAEKGGMRLQFWRLHGRSGTSEVDQCPVALIPPAGECAKRSGRSPLAPSQRCSGPALSRGWMSIAAKPGDPRRSTS